jgi:tyrosyl-tRNA synthetase
VKNIMPTTTTTQSFLDELEWRGLLNQMTADEPLRKHLQTPGRVGYCGFDPTSDSLTIGNLVAIMLLKRWQLSGHKPIVIMGGGTGLIGDPSGKDAERALQTPEQVEANIAGQRRMFEALLECEQSPGTPVPGRSSDSTKAVILNNYDWLKDISYIDMLRDVGKHFSIGAMIARDSVKRRLEEREHGISYTEFSYMILQAYDFLHLRRHHNCTVQMAGSDQYGNIVSGIDLIRREFGQDEAFGITAPLLLTAEGRKFGKTEHGAIWLTADRTSPYAFYQFWINSGDEDVIRYLKIFTLLSKEEIDDLEQRHAAAPHERIAQRELARHVTAMLHGEEQVRHVEAASQALFSGDVKQLDEAMLREVFADVPHSTHEKSTLEGEGVSLVELLPQTSVANSKREAREFLANGAVSVNGEKVDLEAKLTTSDLLHGTTILLRRGKKNWHATKWT